MGKPTTVTGRGPVLVFVFGVICSSIIGLSARSPPKICDMSKCKGPSRFYEEINCEPVKKEPGDCCPFRYNCPHMSANRASDKCYVNDNVYSIGEELKGEDRAYRCDICTCVKRDESERAHFSCAIIEPFGQKTRQPKDGCYLRKNFMDCSAEQEVCPEKPDDRPKCVVDGKTYLDGEGFTPENSPHLTCQCAEGYKGENVAPFCRRNKCGLEFRHHEDLKRNCAPVYHSSQPLHTSCFPYGSFRCQNHRDKIIPMTTEGPDSVPREVPDEEKCMFGNLTMLIGERLTTATDYSSVCVECTCEVPPLPTCVRLPDDKCDVTKHPEFKD